MPSMSKSNKSRSSGRGGNRSGSKNNNPTGKNQYSGRGGSSSRSSSSR
jgi:hypothetical protein